MVDGRVKLRDEPADAFSIIWEGLGTVAFPVKEGCYKSRFADVDAYVCHIIKSFVRNYIFCTLVANTGSVSPPQRTIQSLDVKAWGPIVLNGVNQHDICLIPCLNILKFEVEIIQKHLTVQMYDMADLKVTRFVIGGQPFVIPSAAADQEGLMSANDFKKLSGIETGAQANVLEGVKVNGVALSIASKIVDILIATGSTNGTISVQGVDVPIKGLAALAYKANVSADELDAALKTVIDAKAESSEVTELSGKIDVLNGTGAGSVAKVITDAFNDFATKVSDDGVVNSYKELIDWAAEHGGEAAEMTAAISNIEGLLTGIGGEGNPATVKAAIAAAISDLNIGNYYTKTQVDTALNGKVDKDGDKVLSQNDFTNTYKEKLDGIAKGATANTYAYDEATQTLTLSGFTAA